MSVPNLISERNVSGNNACAAGSGLGHSEMGIPGCWVVVLPLLCAVAPGKTFLLSPFSHQLVFWGGFLLGNTDCLHLDRQRGAHAVSGELR